MKSILYGLLPALLLFWPGCGAKPESRVPEAKPQVAKETVAVVSFIRGEARVYRENVWSNLSLGQELAADDSLDVPSGVQVELRNKEQKVYKLSGPARGPVSTIIAQAAQSEPGAASQAISKIKKLEGRKQKFETRTPTAVAGIRGTRARATPDTIPKDSLSE